MKAQLFVFATFVAICSSAPSLAANRDRVGDVVAARNRIASAAQHTKGQPRANLDIERFRLNRLIAELESGAPVDPMRIDDEIRRAMRLYR